MDMFMTLFQQLFSPRFSGVDVFVVLLGLAFGVWVGFRMAFYKVGAKQPKVMEPFVDDKKGFKSHVMRDLISEAFDLDETPEVIPIRKPRG